MQEFLIEDDVLTLFESYSNMHTPPLFLTEGEYIVTVFIRNNTSYLGHPIIGE